MPEVRDGVGHANTRSVCGEPLTKRELCTIKTTIMIKDWNPCIHVFMVPLLQDSNTAKL